MNHNPGEYLENRLEYNSDEYPLQIQFLAFSMFQPCANYSLTIDIQNKEIRVTDTDSKSASATKCVFQIKDDALAELLLFADLERIKQEWEKPERNRRWIGYYHEIRVECNVVGKKELISLDWTRLYENDPLYACLMWAKRHVDTIHFKL